VFRLTFGSHRLDFLMLFAGVLEARAAGPQVQIGGPTSGFADTSGWASHYPLIPFHCGFGLAAPLTISSWSSSRS